MHIDYDNYEYKKIISDILNNREFKKIENYKHHSTNRLEHSLRVSFYSYKICKKIGLDYKSAARGGLLHDFFLNTYKDSIKRKLLQNHPYIALYNANKHFKLNDTEKDIIKSHMFPVNTKTVPKYKESYIITFVDKIACIYERYIGCKSKAEFGMIKVIMYMLLILNN